MKLKLKKPLVTIVIPFYNVEYYLMECLNSIVRQTYGINNIETLLVDDCGTDSSINIAEEYLPFLGKHVKLIRHEKNKGLGGARNTGIENASGEYIMFIDSDDYIDRNTIEELIYTITKDKSSVAIYNMNCFSELNKKYPLNPSFDLFNLVTDNSMKINRYEFPKYPELAHSFSACNKLFRLDLFNIDKRFPEKQHHEDALLISNLLADSTSISLVKNVYYQYRQRESINDKSITDTLFDSKEHFFEHIQIVEGLKKIAIKYPELEYMLLWVSLRIMGTPIKNLLTNKTSMTKEEDNQFFNRTKIVFKGREIKYTYSIGDKIAKFAVDCPIIIINSKSLDNARMNYFKNTINNKINIKKEVKSIEKSVFKRKLRKLIKNPKLFFNDRKINLEKQKRV